MILFQLQTLGAGRHIPIFLEFLINIILKNIRFFLMLRFFVYVVFFYWNEIENPKTTNVTV